MNGSHILPCLPTRHQDTHALSPSFLLGQHTVLEFSLSQPSDVDEGRKPQGIKAHVADHPVQTRRLQQERHRLGEDLGGGGRRRGLDSGGSWGSGSGGSSSGSGGSGSGRLAFGVKAHRASAEGGRHLEGDGGGAQEGQRKLAEHGLLMYRNNGCIW